MQVIRDDQRRFLIELFGTYVENRKLDVDKSGALGPGNSRDAELGPLAISWLRGEIAPSSGVRAFLEEFLSNVEVETDYEQILKTVYEHDALVAAIEELR
jgi:hypothetical protein